MAMLARKCAELQKLKGGEDELQLTLKLLEDAQKQVAQAEKLTRREAGTAASAMTSRASRSAVTDPRSSSRSSGCSCAASSTMPTAHARSAVTGSSRWPASSRRSEMIDVVEVKYQVVQVEQQKYVCRCGGAVETAPGPERAVAGGRYSLRFALKVVFDKYLAHLPLERQARLMAHAGLEITSQTLWDQCWAATRLLEPTYDAHLRAAARRAGDRPRPDRLAGPRGQEPAAMADVVPAQRRAWCTTGSATTRAPRPSRRCWASTTVGWSAMRWERTRPGARNGRGIKLAALLGARAPPIPRSRGRPSRGADHARVDRGALRNRPEGRERSRSAAVCGRQSRRRCSTRCAPGCWSSGIRRARLSARAVRYTLRQLGPADGLRRRPGHLARQQRDRACAAWPVVGRRNHFGSKSVRGTEMAAMLYSLVETAKVCGLDPIAYLLEVATRALRTPGAVLLPDRLQGRSRGGLSGPSAVQRSRAAVTTGYGGEIRIERHRRWRPDRCRRR